MNNAQKQAFLDMPLDEQLLAIIDGQTFIRTKLEQLEKRQLNFEDDQREYRKLREKNELDIDALVNKIIEAVRHENAR
jgi:hypothetical protein